MKTTMSEMKNIWDGINGRPDIAEEKIINFKNINLKTWE